MTVLTNKHDARIFHGEECTICGGHLFLPYLEWRGEQEIHICNRCCQEIKGGFIADLVQITAIGDLQKYYPDFTLAREHLPALEKRMDDEEERLRTTLLREIEDGGTPPEAA